MKKVYKFSKFFVPAVILSVLLIAGGICSVLTKGFNKGLDFAPGQSIEVQIDNNSISFEDVAKTLEPLGKKIEVKAVTNEGKVSYQIRTALTEEAPVEETDAKAAEAKEVNKDA
ncbi:MAG: hypothetical protein J6Y93_02035, partial [Treponema sp.]|nr:hypothetical protein [Treponema sp.]